MRGDLQDSGGILSFTILGGHVCCRNDGYDATGGLKHAYQVDLVRIGYAQRELRVHELTQHIHAHFNLLIAHECPMASRGLRLSLAGRTLGSACNTLPHAPLRFVRMDNGWQFGIGIPGRSQVVIKEGNVQPPSASRPVTFIGLRVQ
jgi:hypothetical protein